MCASMRNKIASRFSDFAATTRGVLKNLPTDLAIAAASDLASAGLPSYLTVGSIWMPLEAIFEPGQQLQCKLFVMTILQEFWQQ